jgi:hypothetical protein
MTIKVIGSIARPPRQARAVGPARRRAALRPGHGADSGSAVSRLPDTSEKLLSKVRKLAVTLETSDSPHGSGALVFSGNCAKLW